MCSTPGGHLFSSVSEFSVVCRIKPELQSLKMSAIRQNFHVDCEAAINKQINNELASSYYYLAVAFHFDRDDVALANFHKYFCNMSEKKKANADKLVKYMNERGGRVNFFDIPMPANNFREPVDVMQDSLERERLVSNAYLLGLSIPLRDADKELRSA